jgi:hypothetical protein
METLVVRVVDRVLLTADTVGFLPSLIELGVILLLKRRI